MIYYVAGVLTVPAILVGVALWYYFGLNRDVGKLK